MLSTIQDWQVLDSDGDDFTALVKKCASDYWIRRVQSMVICLIGGTSDSLTLEVLEYVESIFEARFVRLRKS